MSVQINENDLIEYAEQFTELGYVVVRQLFDDDTLTQIRDGFMSEAHNGPVAGLSDWNGKEVTDDPLSRYPRMMHPHLHLDRKIGRIAREILLDARIGEILLALYGEEAVATQSMFYFKPPGARGQELHQDNYYLRVHPGTCMAAWIAVDDADEENGTLVVVPKTHQHEIECPQMADMSVSFTADSVKVPVGFEKFAVNLKAGDCLFFNGSLIHGSYPNTSTDRFRRALINHYVPLSSCELSDHYHSIKFDGTPVEFAAATGGGPCGEYGAPAGVH